VSAAGELPRPVAALLDPALHGCASASVALRETHVSWVVLAGERVYKVKKPVAFAFVDQRTLARRRELCEAEAALNRPLAPTVYLGVVAIVPAGGAARFALAPADDPRAVEYAVEMRRFDESTTLAALAARGGLGSAAVRDVARRLAAFHREAPVARDLPTSGRAALARGIASLDRNVEELLALVDGAGRGRVVAQLRCASAYLVGHADSIAARAADGLVRELHGDLRAEHVLIGPPVQLVDRLEFNRAWREVDVADELAFLAMDLTARGHPAQARLLLEAYRAAGGDLGERGLVAFYALYRAHVRAKVALLRRAQTGADEPGVAALLDTAERFAWSLRLPRVLVVCGPSATGKSRLAAELARRSARPVIASDELRKLLVGVDRHAQAPASAYRDEVSLRVYAELARRACAAPDGAIVDATFRSRAHRAAFDAALSRSAGSPRFVVLSAPAAVVRSRAERRLAEAERVSDATPALALSQLQAFEPLDEVAPERHHPLRGDRPVERVADALAAALDAAISDGAGP
jgi:aminoglycoside phosphotransferase family enzyme/predicted kinase